LISVFVYLFINKTIEDKSEEWSIVKHLMLHITIYVDN
jgi:hypothetical protein